MGEVDYFAENGCDPRRRFTARANGPVELLLLTKTNLLALAEDFRPEVAKLFDGAKTRLSTLLDLKERAKNWY